MFSALKSVVDVVSHITSWGGANYTCIVFLRLSAHFGCHP